MTPDETIHERIPVMRLLDSQLAAFTMTLLRAGDRYLLLRRSESKTFAPGRWTGVGGRVESREFDDLVGSARREITEETGLAPNEVSNLRIRRALLQVRPGHPLIILIYLTGEATDTRVHSSREGSLHWVQAPAFATLDIIDNTALVLPLLIRDMVLDPTGETPIMTGAVSYTDDGALDSIVWSR